MKTKGLSLIILILLVVSMIGVVSAITKTVVAGTIYNADYTVTEADASVEVTCNGSTNTTSSSSDGTYVVKFDAIDCPVNSSLLVHAEKGERYGDNTHNEKVHNGNEFGIDVNLGVAPVALIPEFGAVVGVLTILSALSVFFVIRRK